MRNILEPLHQMVDDQRHSRKIVEMQSVANITGVAHVIQLAVAPVFLLTSVAALLSVMTNRLGRVIDRFRVPNSPCFRSPSAQRAY